MTKAELIDMIAEIEGVPSKRVAGEAIDGVFEAIRGALKKGDSVTLVGFGTWVVTKRKARKGRNPQTGEAIKIPAKKVPKFRPGKDLRDGV